MDSFAKEFEKIEARHGTGAHLRETERLKGILTARPIVLYGVGFFGAVIHSNFADSGIPVECFCDTFKTGVDAETGLRIISPDDLKRDYAHANVVLSVANVNTQTQVYNQILSMGFDKGQVFTFDTPYRFFKKSRVEVVKLSLEEMKSHYEGYEWAYNLFDDERSKQIILDSINGYLFNDLMPYFQEEQMYFPKEFRFTDSEVFVDAGLYYGGTTEEFLRWCNGAFRRIYGFEIDPANFQKVRPDLLARPDITLMQKGLWSRALEARATLGFAAGSKVGGDGSEGSDVVSLVSLDEVFASLPLDEYPTFIKMDVEGAEKEALTGAARVIGTARPKLAVCVYHKPEDIYELPRIIQCFNADYRFTLKHHSPYRWDTVLYAWQGAQ
jgi:FkbM family methyltransferase